MHLVPRSSIEVTVKTLTGKSFALEVYNAETIRTVKQKIQKLEGLAIDRQCLIFARKQLADQDRVQDYKLTDGNTIHLVMRPGPSLPSSLPGTCESPGACGLANMGVLALGLGRPYPELRIPDPQKDAIAIAILH